MQSRYNKLHSSTEVTAKIHEMAMKIIADHLGTPPLFIALLRGANPFASLLMFEIARQAPDFHPDISYMMVKTYGDSQTASEPQVITDLPPDVAIIDRDIIIVDDVLDSGITTDFVRNILYDRGAASVKIAVLAQKAVVRAADITADYCSFDCGSKWLTGMGMDDTHSGDEHNRWLDEIWEVAH